MKYFSLLATKLASGACFFAMPFSLIANENQVNPLVFLGDEQHTPVAQRSTECQEVLTDSIASDSEKEEDLNDENALIARKVFCSSHAGAYHHPIAVSGSGDNITLEDGSIWYVREKDQVKTLDWLIGDTIVILPNHAFFSSYKFVLFNQTTGREVKANLLLGPVFNGVFTHWITAIDYEASKVWLEDGSRWDLACDKSKLKKWLVNDTIIIGIEDSWFSDKSNILINVNLANSISSECKSCP